MVIAEPSYFDFLMQHRCRRCRIPFAQAAGFLPEFTSTSGPRCVPSAKFHSRRGRTRLDMQCINRPGADD